MSIAAELTRLIRAINNLDEAAKTCEYDQAYFLHRGIQAVEDAESAYIQALRNELGIHLSDNP